MAADETKVSPVKFFFITHINGNLKHYLLGESETCLYGHTEVRVRDAHPGFHDQFASGSDV